MEKTSAREQGLRLFKYVTKERRDVGNIYIYAILSGLVQLSVPLGIQAIVSYAMGATMVTSIYLLIAFVVLGTWLVGLFRLKVMQIIEKIQQKIFVEYAIAYAEKLPRLKLSKVARYFLPELVNRFFDTQNLQKGISKILLEIPTAIIQIVFSIVLLTFYHPWFLVFGVFVIMSVVFIFRLSMEQGIASSLLESDKKYEVASWLEDVAASVKTFKVNSSSELHLAGTDNRLVEYLNHRTSHFKVLLFQYKTIIAFKVLITFAMLAMGTYLLINQQLNIGAFIATEIVLLTIMSAVEKLIKSLESYYDVITSLAKLSKLLDLPEEQPGQLVTERQSKGFEVEFKDVSFSFNDNIPVLKNVDFKLSPNSLTVISGTLGSGKSILLNLLAGFYEPDSGMIFYDHVPVSNLNKDLLRDKIGLYLEDMHIVKGTVLENIQLGNASITSEKIGETLMQIGVEHFAAHFTSGLLTEISETDTQLSFSTRKIILLLRALLGRNRMVLMEDPLEGLGEQVRGGLMAYLLQEAQHRNMIIVTQDSEIISKAHHHLHLSDGKVEMFPPQN